MTGTRLFFLFLFTCLTTVSFCHKGDRNANGTVACKGEVAVGKSKEGARKSKTMMPSVMIMDRGVRAPERLVSFMLINNRGLDSLYVARLVKTYIIECRIEGVNHDVAFCQMCLETGFLRFTGSVSRYQNNFCGLGAINAYTAGDWFGSLEEGVRAHIQHLKAYASVDRIVSPVVDHRFGRVQRGTVFTIYDLSGTWAADPEYGSKIDYLLQKLYQH